MKKALYYSFSFLFIIFALFSLIMPFSISAEGVSGSNFILGVDCYYYDYDREYYAIKYNVTLTENNAGNGYTGNMVVATTASGATLNHTLYRYVFVLDNYYVGAVTFNSQVGSSSARTYYINGNSFEVVSETYFTSFTITTENLQRCDFDTWAFPVESFNICSYMLNNHSNEYVGITHQSDYLFPIFKIQTNDILFATNVADNDNWIQTFIFYITAPSGSPSINSVTNFNENFTLTRGTCLTYKTINRYQFNGQLGYICQVTIGNYGSSGALNIAYTGSVERYFMPIYCNSQVFNKNVSTDFALVFGMSNQLLDDLHYIAQNFQPSQEVDDAVSNLDDQSSSALDTFNNYDSLESDFNDSMNNALNDITITDPSTMGTKFQASASWVKTQFDRFTDSTPFGSILGFSLILGLSLLVIGRIVR